MPKKMSDKTIKQLHEISEDTTNNPDHAKIWNALKVHSTAIAELQITSSLIKNDLSWIKALIVIILAAIIGTNIFY